MCTVRCFRAVLNLSQQLFCNTVWTNRTDENIKMKATTEQVAVSSHRMKRAENTTSGSWFGTTPAYLTLQSLKK